MENSFFNSKINRTLVVVALVALIIALGSYAFYTMKQAKYFYTGPVTISVTGDGEVSAVPNIGQFSFSVTASGTDAVAAQGSSGSKVKAILAYLKEKGVEEKDIKTDSYNVYPKFRYDAVPCTVSYCPPSKEIADGFEASQNVSVKVRNLDLSGELIAGVGNFGATNISSLQFTIDDTSALKNEARAKAIADAKAKAKVLSDNLGVRIIKMTGYYENEGPVYGYGMGGEAMKASDNLPVPSLPVGENTVKSQVNITYIVR